MNLSKLYYVYGLDTACFYDDEEFAIEQKIIKARKLKGLIKNRYSKYLNEIQNIDNGNKLLIYDNIKHKTKNELNFLNNYINKYKALLKSTLAKNSDNIRTVRQDSIYDKKGNHNLKRRASIFESDLIRRFNLKEREFNDEIVIVKVYFFDVAKSIVDNGFYMNNQKYIFFSSSAGQIRTKKLVAVREDLLNKNWNALTCGLSVENINKQGGMNINKYLAYLSLCNSATELWAEFDINRCIVVDDFENTVTGGVDFIDEKTYEITRQIKDLPLNQTDGCGMILPCLSDRNFMVRLPWVKGLLAKFDFLKFIKENHCSSIITDIYGAKHDIIAENIQIIFTKSQFKMYSFFSSWKEYKENFKKYNCNAGKCNVEDDIFPLSVINYQMIQTLSDMTDDEIKSLANTTNNNLVNLSSNLKTMLKVFGVNNNTSKTYFQKCLEIYPELISDTYSRKTLKDLKDKLEKELWSARFEIGGKYTFVIPDLYAFCEYLFMGKENPKGLLKDGEVCCRLFNDGKELDCLRSPHLYREHPIRKNNTNYDWFDTNGIYVSSHDFISRVLQNDFDGDKLLVTDNEMLVKIAKRNMKNIVPLYYNMSKAKAEIITSDSLYNGLINAYNGGNIGIPSNDITKIWNSGEITKEKIDVIKWLCLEVNFTIDYAKTLYKPKRPNNVNSIINKYTKAKIPYFFMFAKGKKREQVNKIGDNIMDRISIIYPKKRLNFNFKIENIGRFDYTLLMNNPNVEINESIVKEFKKIVSHLNFNNKNEKDMYNYYSIYDLAKNEILALHSDPNYIIDNIILEIFHNKKTPMKKAFWTLFGEYVYNNLSKNIADGYIQCEKCHKRFYRNREWQKYCGKCSKKTKTRKTKIINCIDCGIEVRIPMTRNNTSRCSNCQSVFNNLKRAEWIKNKRKQECRKVEIPF